VDLGGILARQPVLPVSADLKVPAIERQLQIDVRPAKPQFQPGEEGRLRHLSARRCGAIAGCGQSSAWGLSTRHLCIQRNNRWQHFQLLLWYASTIALALKSSLNFYFNEKRVSGHGFWLFTEWAEPLSLKLKPSEPLVPASHTQGISRHGFVAGRIAHRHQWRAQASADFPRTSLTTWRATVRGVTADTNSRHARSIEVVVRKNLMVRLAVPRFFRQEMKSPSPPSVHNYLETNQECHRVLGYEGLDVVDGATRQVEVASKTDTKGRLARPSATKMCKRRMSLLKR